MHEKLQALCAKVITDLPKRACYMHGTCLNLFGIYTMFQATMSVKF